VTTGWAAYALTTMDEVAVSTGSLYEADEDGLVDDPLVFDWSGSSAEFRSTVIASIEGMMESMVFDEVTPFIVGDTHGFIKAMPLGEHADLRIGLEGVMLDYSLEAEGVMSSTQDDQIETFDVKIMGDGTTLLGQETVVILIPGT
jgi:hypothetical protein